MKLATLAGRSLQSKLLWGTVLVICLLMAAVMAVVEHRQHTAVVDEAQARRLRAARRSL